MTEPTTHAGRHLAAERLDTENGPVPLVPFASWITDIEAEARQQERDRIKADVLALMEPSGRSPESYDVMTRGGAFRDVLAVIEDAD